MDALSAAYDSDSSGGEGEREPVRETSKDEAVSINAEESSSILSRLKEKFPLNSAPSVPVREHPDDLLRVGPDTKEVTYNPTVEQLYAPEVGPANPFKTRQQLAEKNTLSGFVEPAHFDKFQFENQRRTFHSYGYALDPTAMEAATIEPVGDQQRADEMKGVSVFEIKQVNTGKKRKRNERGDPGDLDGYMGPWREYVDQEKVSKPTEEQMAILDKQFGEKEKAKKKSEDETIKESTTLHVENPRDYLGRSYLHIPQDMDVDLRTEEPPKKCYAPKKLIHSWIGHTKGIAAIRLFPRSGHLLLSAGMDSKIKLWEVYGERRLLRTYTGHVKAVRDICFNRNGTKFLSCSYDRYIKLWDTETGECLARFTNQKTPYCVRFNPDEDKQNLFLVGCSDKKIYCFDIENGEIVQEYDRHLGAVNSITFVDENRRFVTTSDDKSLRVWEWNIPVDMKYVAEPHMHSMPSVTLSPNEKWLACQSMDNQVLIYGVHNNFRLNRRKSFKGHMVAGYACSVDFSPEGTLVVSGDADGKLTVWEWRTTRILTRFKAQDSVCSSCLWLPHETSKVISCGWDGKIHLWD